MNSFIKFVKNGSKVVLGSLVLFIMLILTAVNIERFIILSARLTELDERINTLNQELSYDYRLETPSLDSYRENALVEGSDGWNIGDTLFILSETSPLLEMFQRDIDKNNNIVSSINSKSGNINIANLRICENCMYDIFMKKDTYNKVVAYYNCNKESIVWQDGYEKYVSKKEYDSLPDYIDLLEF